jgi:hypothetical protein
MLYSEEIFKTAFWHCSDSVVIFVLLLNQTAEEKVQKDKQRSTKHTYKIKDRVTRTPLKTWGELR